MTLEQFKNMLKKDIVDRENSILEKMKDFIVENVKDYSNQKGEICFIALEYFYDGVSSDIGLRIGLQEERRKLEEEYGKEQDVREDGGEFSFYKPILENESIKSDSTDLFNYLDNIDEDDIDMVWAMIQLIANELTEILEGIKWDGFAKISEDFEVLGPYDYD